MTLQAFYDTFNEGFKYYQQGDWKKAKRIFEFVPKMKGTDDKVSEILLKFMAEHNYIAPSRWEGVREVDI